LCGAMFARAQTELMEQKSEDTGFFMLGAGIGMPSGVALIGGYDFGVLAMRISGGGWQKGWYGVDGDLALHFNHSTSFAHGLSVIVGRYGANPVNDQGVREYKTQNFFGLTYDIYLAGFFLQAGLAFGHGDYPSPDAVYQVGYLFTF
jgi:nitrate reductase NapE component